ncbi:redox-regulated ATPase YchF [candidate division WWE3 bacterium RIFCSPHIGHO2_01_FULL_40_23]|uniref:Ribosome-binding ATPase YchF n=1 Tax=candidate division WWE3 bacterium RIFCSPLOWO2_01_FULL_41_18 TaxID=1802625 RepID=A0A1F4VE78_UNCKA|nr:MAG: redox-regulated ATPase YchF [candidate division WWE3 bacterium RIFCSPHIGHO2_01_FULL_40_23]OGC55474.1 MAG: redox-regulated ATPase YchF [candidate division WWE3 bacterium RIFCSPLOWO2_01_FULL_41_18]
MSLAIGIVGLPNVGKSTLFNALLKRQVALAANYPFATIEPNVGVVEVPDERLEKLKEVVKNDYGKEGGREVPEKTIYAAVKFVDIAGLVEGAHKGEGLGNQFLSHIREVDAIVEVVRAFEDENVVRSGSKDPKSDIEVIKTELILADLQTLSKQRTEIKGKVEKGEEAKILGVLKLKEALDKGALAKDVLLTEEEKEQVKSLNLLTAKPFIYVFNVSENDLTTDKFSDYENSVAVSAKIESELSVLSSDDQKLFMKEYGLEESGLDKVIKKGFEILSLQTFLTAGPKEVRAWTIKKGSKAPQAAGVIHTDFERGFIAVDVIACEDLVSIGSYHKAKELGKIRLEGKEYEMKDGDVVEFRFSV